VTSGSMQQRIGVRCDPRACRSVLVRLRGQRGVALVVVLWVLTLLTLVAAAVAGSTRTTSTLARNSVEAIKARRLAETGFQSALLGLAETEPARRWAADGSEHAWSTEHGSLRVSIRDEAAFVNINHAGPELLGGLLGVAGIDGERREALVDAVLDWRDQDSIRRLRGAEDDDYAAAGRTYGAKDGPFDNTAELQSVLGMSAAIFESIEPFVTVYGRHAGVNRAAAPREVLLAMPGFDAPGVDRIVDERQAAQPGEGGLRSAASVVRPDIVRVTVHAELPSGARHGLRVVVRLRAALSGEHAILSWQDVGGSGQDSRQSPLQDPHSGAQGARVQLLDMREEGVHQPDRASGGLRAAPGRGRARLLPIQHRSRRASLLQGLRHSPVQPAPLPLAQRLLAHQICAWRCSGRWSQYLDTSTRASRPGPARPFSFSISTSRLSSTACCSSTRRFKLSPWRDNIGFN
jgi:general secretion pathway protein K